MPSSTNAAVLSLLAASALSSGCSSSDLAVAAGDAQAQDGAPLADGAPRADGAPVADGGPSPWLSNSTGFVLAESGGGVDVFPDGAACTAFTMTWSYDADSRQLAQRGCDADGRRVDATVVLTLASVMDLVGHLESLPTVGPSPNMCGEDYPAVTLAVLGPGSTQQAYESDFYSACSFAPADAGGYPYIPYEALDDLQTDLEGYLAACAPADGGPVDDTRATCVTATADAGVDGSVGDAGDGG
jgi:hypothetical protein